MPRQSTQRSEPTTAEKANAFNVAVQGLVDSGVARKKAIKEIADSMPSLHQAFIEQSNAPTVNVGNAAERAKIIAAWGDQVRATAKAHRCDRHKAAAIAARENPTLHAQMLRATNPNAPW